MVVWALISYGNSGFVTEYLAPGADDEAWVHSVTGGQ